MAKKSVTFKGKVKPFGKSGHFHEPRRHSLQARGFKTGTITAKGRAYLDYLAKKSQHLLAGRLSLVRFAKDVKAYKKVYKIKDTDRDGVPDVADCDPTDPTKQDILSVPYASGVSFYGNPKTKQIIYTQTEYRGKGWYAITVGEHTKTTRDKSDVFDMLSQYYPNYKELSLFSETSYHSSLGQSKVGKISKYGTEDYTLDYSSYVPVGKYQLKKPVKTEHKKGFGKEIKSVELQKWNYVVIHWTPVADDKVELQVRHTVSIPFKKESITKYKSRKYKEAEKDLAIADFKRYVEKIR